MSAREIEAAKDAAGALAKYLIERDWPNATPREIVNLHAFRYGTMAAAIINGEAWAIREAWPTAAYDILTMGGIGGR